ncbi:hypothetical protein CO038_03755 [Candidatus Pacearchaeota archaeon CG_4_9_14_0_2_um_filter_39_13]|nr:hypothetical protein [Candidatus Pacearchaeota archaeon]OIO43521.1 MAG: hypothetical protein AUJ64_02265 [Candidatus Pacearchaeota archaeon CG1_02_39_14]PJC44439.1 MAG: hypothetical protein CO038_03755 [Candidatus Pacearchaeota archaeon CG_4_9_14_0_2_um_filter_39_13]
MPYETLAFTLDLVGKVMLGLTVFLVHNKVVKEKGIDKIVLAEIKHEKYLSLIGILLMILGYLFHFLP